MTDDADSVRACLLPPAVLAELQRESGADIITIYLSNPAAPYDRASYVLLGQLGVLPSYQPYMWGPLPPRSLTLFSAADHQKTLRIKDVGATNGAALRFRESAFTREHGIRSLTRLSVRLPVADASDDRVKEPDPAPGLLPPFVEVFLNYRVSLSEEELVVRAQRGLDALLRRARSILEHAALRRLLSLRSVGARFRKLQRIVDRFGNESEPIFTSPADRSRVRNSIENCFNGIDDFLRFELTGGNPGGAAEIAITLHMVERWGDDLAAFETYPVHGHPAEVRSRLDLELRRNPTRGLCRYVAHSGQSVAVEDMARAPETIAAAFIHIGISGASITFPVLSGERVIGVVNIESTNRAIVAEAQAVWQVLPAIEALLHDAMRLQEQADESSMRYVLKTFTTLRMSPRRDAIQYRIDTLCKVLEARECALVLGPAGGPSEVFSACAKDASSMIAGEDLHDLILESIVARSGKKGGVQAISLCLSTNGKEATLLSAHAYRRGHGSPQKLLREDTVVDSVAISAAISIASTARVVEVVALPIHRLRQDANDDIVMGSLILVADDGRPRATHSWLNGLIEIASSLQMVLHGIERLETERNLFSWATAGLGSIHDIVGAIGRAIDALDNDVGDPRETARLLEAVRDQLLLLGSLARNEPNEPDVGDDSDLGSIVRSIVEQSTRLVGHRSEECTVEIENETARVSFGGGQLRNALCHILGNAFKYGGTKTAPRVHASYRDHTLSIEVCNRAFKDKFGDALREAISIVDEVEAGNSAEALRRILRRREGPQMQGIGTWLTARIAKDVLHGSYGLSIRPLDNELLEVVAVVTLPTPAKPATTAAEPAD